MTLADEARDNSISCEMVKYAYRQSRDGVVVSFVVHPNDVPAALSTSHIGARYVAVLVQIGDDEQPIPLKTAKEKQISSAKPSLAPDKPSGKAKRDWRDMKPSAQAAIRCGEPIFWAYLNEEHGYNVTNKEEAAEAVRDKCGVKSRAHLDVETFHASHMIWHQLDSGYAAWKALEHA